MQMNRLMTHGRGIAPWLCAALLGAGCAPNAGAEMRSRIQVMERAREPAEALRKAEAYASIGDLTRAEQYLRLAISGGADEREVMPLLVQVCVRDQRYLDAVQHVEGYLKHHPDDHRLRFVLASLEAAVGNHERAHAEYEKVLTQEANNAEVHYALAVVLRDNLASFAQADQHFREYLRLRPSGDHAEEARAALLEVVP
jgi:tetratricopeptide (TPR) repeat protein